MAQIAGIDSRLMAGALSLPVTAADLNRGALGETLLAVNLQSTIDLGSDTTSTLPAGTRFTVMTAGSSQRVFISAGNVIGWITFSDNIGQPLVKVLQTGTGALPVYEALAELNMYQNSEFSSRAIKTLPVGTQFDLIEKGPKNRIKIMVDGKIGWTMGKTDLQQSLIKAVCLLATIQQEDDQSLVAVGGMKSVAPDRRAELFAEAAWRLEDTLETPQEVPLKYPLDILQARLANFAAVRARVNYGRALVGLVLLSVFETPTWCSHEVHPRQSNPSCGSSVSPEIMLSGVPYVPVAYGIAIEFILMLVLSQKFLLEKRVQTKYFDTMEPKQFYYSMNRVHCGLAFLVFELCDCAIFIIFRPKWRFAFIARTGLLCLQPQVISLCKLVSTCLWEFVSVAVFLLGAIFIFAMTAVTIIGPLEHGAEGFQTFTESLNSMFVSGVSADFYVVMLKSYTAHRWTGLIWLIFLVVVHILLLSLVLDTLVAAYMSYSEAGAEDIAEKKVAGILRTFRTLCVASRAAHRHPGQIPKKDVLEFMQEIQKSPIFNPISPEKAYFMYTAIDKDDSGWVDHEEFCGICKVIQTKFKTTRKNSFLASWYPQAWESPRYKRWRIFVEGPTHHYEMDEDAELPVEHVIGKIIETSDHEQPKFERIMNWVLMVNLALVVLETSYDLNNVEEPAFFDYLELMFSFVYVGEVMAKLSVVSFEEYWAYGSNRFDLFSTVLLLSASLAERLFTSNISTYANIFRLLRLFRVIKNLKNIPSVQFMVKTVSKLVEAAKDMMLLLWVVIYFFTMLSVQVSGGQLHGGDERLEGTEYMETHMFALNFNDFFSAFGLWFCMLLQEYNPSFPDALAKVQTNKLDWLMFPIFYLCAVSITFELVKAFTIEVFMALYKEKNAAHDPKANSFVECMDGLMQALTARGENLHYYVKGLAEEQHLFQEALEELEHKAHAAGKGIMEILDDPHHSKHSKHGHH